MRPTSVTVSSQTTSAPIPVNWRAKNFGLSVFVDVTGTNTSTVQHTFDNIYDPAVTPTWMDHASLAAMTADEDGNYAFPVRAVRLNVTAWTSGSATMTLIHND